MVNAWTVQPGGFVADRDGVRLVLPASALPKFRSIVSYLQTLIDDNARRTGVPAAWIAGIVWAETGFLGAAGGHSDAAVSPAGAVGRMQLMPFWFLSPTAIGDGKPHTRDEMTHNDALNMRFGTDLLNLIRKDGNELPAAASIYNCGSTTNGHPWRPKPMASNHFQLCAEGNYIETVVAAHNSYLLDHRTTANGSGPTLGGVVAALGLGAASLVVADRLLR